MYTLYNVRQYQEIPLYLQDMLVIDLHSIAMI